MSAPEIATTSQYCRRAVTHLWTARRIVEGADLTTDDIELLREVLLELQGIVEACND